MKTSLSLLLLAMSLSLLSCGSERDFENPFAIDQDGDKLAVPYDCDDTDPTVGKCEIGENCRYPEQCKAGACKSGLCTCDPKYTGANCDECSDPKYTGAECDECAPKYTGAECDECSPGLSGIACDEGMVLIPSGSFMMGSPEGELGQGSDEEQHEVTLTQAFFLDATEVTQGEWESLMGNTPSKNSGCSTCPVERVSYWDALAYANALSASEGLPACYDLSGCTGSPGTASYDCSGVALTSSDGTPYGCVGFRLPTESEWEYAYRAGTTTAFYSGGISKTGCNEPNLAEIGWYCGTAAGQTHPVGGKAPNAWGLYDMAGNVWEWVWDWHGSYPTTSVEDPMGVTGGSKRVIRGGGFYDFASYLRAAYRGVLPPGYAGDDRGFRCARSAP